MAADISIVLTTHREGILVPRTVRSLSDAAAYAANHGVSCELVIVLDDPDALTRSIIADLDLSRFAASKIVEVRLKSPGPARNAGVAAATGAYLTTTDGDDLVSFNYLLDMYRSVTSAAGVAMAFPEYQIVFGDDDYVCKTFSLARAGLERFAEEHTHTSRGIAARQVFDAIPFRDCKISPLYVYEDYDFNLRVAAAGIRLIEVEDVAFYYRARRNSFMTSLHDSGRYLPPPSEFFHPGTVLRPDSGEVEPFPPTAAVDAEMAAFQTSRRLEVLTHHASGIDPEIELARIKAAPRASNLAISPRFGAAYRAVCAELGGARYSDVVLAPAAAGTPLLEKVMAAATRADPGRSFLVLRAGTDAGALAPPGRLLDLGAAGRDLDAFHVAKLAVRTIETFAPSGVLHLVDGPLPRTVCESFTDALHDFPVVFYYSSAGRSDEDASPDPSQFALLSRYFGGIDRVVCDDESAAAGLTRIISSYATKLTILDPHAGSFAASVGTLYDDLSRARRPERWAPLPAAAMALVASDPRPALADRRPRQPPCRRMQSWDDEWQAARGADAAESSPTAPQRPVPQPAGAPEWWSAARRLLSKPFRP